MVLPIIVPTWEFELVSRFKDAHELPSKAYQLKRPKTVGLQCTNKIAARESDEREMLIAHWREITRLLFPPATSYKSFVHVCELTQGDINSAGDGIDLLASCQWLLRKRLRQDWALLRGTGHAQVLMWVRQVTRDAPVVKVTAFAADAAAWTLFAMYWCGISHPAALFNRALHPPTGLVRWISQFHIDQQANHAREIQTKFAHCMSGSRSQCDLLVCTMLKRTGSVAFLHELCDLSFSGSITTI